MRTLKAHLDRTKNLSFVKRISDFHLLLLLARFLDVNSDVPALAGCVHAQATIPEGYQLLIESMAASVFLVHLDIRVTAVAGQYQIGIYSVRPIVFGKKSLLITTLLQRVKKNTKPSLPRELSQSDR
ncbi:hypothetical protein Tco_0978548 [Tanacetum coccineum]|uniref:Uncharacterized protein n=1 Tax=Tanacetum coccineum TaxID=301880 RepID=A0ABQ5ENA6_9ASTR